MSLHTWAKTKDRSTCNCSLLLEEKGREWGNTTNFYNLVIHVVTERAPHWCTFLNKPQVSMVCNENQLCLKSQIILLFFQLHRDFSSDL